MKKYEYRKLSGRINERYGTRKKFAETLGITETAMSNKMNGISGFSQKDIEKWADLLGIPVSQYSDYFFA